MPVNKSDNTVESESVCDVLGDFVEMADIEEMEEAESLIEAVSDSSPVKDLHTSVQNSIKDQLLLQALPPYSPPISPNLHCDSEQFFSCKDCGDRFLLESSLVRHVERRSVIIFYGCRKCACTMTFYNRCALLAHMRGHINEPNDVTNDILNISQENISLRSQATVNDDDDDNDDGIDSGKDSSLNDVIEVEPDAVSLSTLPKNKIALGPFIPIPTDDRGRLIQEGNDEKQKSVLNDSNQVTSEEKKKLITEGDVTNGCDVLPEKKESEQQSQKSDYNLDSSVSISSHCVSKIEYVAKEKCILLKIRDSNQTSESGDTNICDQSHPKQLSDISATDDSVLENELPDSSECKECGTVPRNGDVKEHFLGSNLPMDEQYRCKSCSLILPSSCSLSAHNRIHSQSKPYICPECTREFSLWASLSVHLLYTCFHMSKTVRYRCLQCKCLLTSAVSLEVHILTQHVKHVYKCNICPIACFSTQALQDHKINKHQLGNLPTHSYQHCQLCPDQLITKSRLLFHVNEHSKDPAVRIYVYQCGDCSFFTQKKTDFATHKVACSRNSKSKIAAVPSAMSPDKVLAAHKIVFSPESKQINNCVKIVYNVPPKQMQIALLPKSAVRTVKKVIIPRVQENKFLSKCSAEQRGSFSNKTQVSGIENDGTLKEVKNPVEAVCKVTSIVENEIQNQSINKKYVYMSAKKCETNAGETEVLFSAAESTIVEKDPLSLDCMTNNNSNTSSASIKGGSVFRLCSICKKELVLFPRTLGTGVSKFPSWCMKCSKERPFLKKDKKYVLVPKDKLVNSKKHDIKNSNGKNELLISQFGKKTVSQNKNSNFKRTTNSIALNGPTSIKRRKSSSGDSAESNKYRCHVCKMLISMDWVMIQQHFAAKHPNFNLLVLSPRVNKLKLNCTGVKVPFIVKDHNIHPKNMFMKRSATEENTSTINQINGNDVHDHVNKDDYFNETDSKMEFDTTYNEEGVSSVENGGFNEFLRRDYDLDDDLIPSKFKKKKKFAHRTPDRGDRERAITPFSSGQIVPALQQDSPSDHKYKCSKCHYTDYSAETFRDHIILHRIDKDAFQCMECGMCFVVRPSFEKHLFVSHRIKDAEAYIQNNNCCDSSAIDDNIEETPPEKEPTPPPEEDVPPDLVENQCRVCREIFETSFQLNKHIRTHGMAFLLMKKREIKVT